MAAPNSVCPCDVELCKNWQRHKQAPENLQYVLPEVAKNENSAPRTQHRGPTKVSEHLIPAALDRFIAYGGNPPHPVFPIRFLSTVNISPKIAAQLPKDPMICAETMQMEEGEPWSTFKEPVETMITFQVLNKDGSTQATVTSTALRCYHITFRLTNTSELIAGYSFDGSYSNDDNTITCFDHTFNSTFTVQPHIPAAQSLHSWKSCFQAIDRNFMYRFAWSPKKDNGDYAPQYFDWKYLSKLSRREMEMTLKEFEELKELNVLPQTAPTVTRDEMEMIAGTLHMLPVEQFVQYAHSSAFEVMLILAHEMGKNLKDLEFPRKLRVLFRAETIWRCCRDGTRIGLLPRELIDQIVEWDPVDFLVPWLFWP